MLHSVRRSSYGLYFFQPSPCFSWLSYILNVPWQDKDWHKDVSIYICHNNKMLCMKLPLVLVLSVFVVPATVLSDSSLSSNGVSEIPKKLLSFAQNP
ncbi:hypothetical protein DVH24_000320 [Malus domestica]|uniref:Uncharacterized protein n=1 Tax=Malus domestica TaxID=3750 RepID=A0A498J5J7_MALDO|nr:hypothetical protein DVH24_000320 [Malus domestica]